MSIKARARGEVVIVEERLGVTMTEIIKSDRTSEFYQALNVR